MGIVGGARRAAVLGLAAALVAGIAGADGEAPKEPRRVVDAAPAWRKVESTTYEQRQAEIALPERAPQALLVLPFGYAAPTRPPRFVDAGEEVDDSAEPWRVIDRLVPRVPLHDEYLRRRGALGAGDGLALVDWCLEKGLDDCAEAEAARFMEPIDDFRKPEYAALLKRWLRVRDRRQSAWSLPLPLEGEWYVLPDKTGHHRLKAWAAYAWDVVRRVGVLTFRDQGKRLEDHYAFGQPVVAQADGVVTDVVDATPDNPPGTLGKYEDANYVTVDYGGGLLVDYAHLKQGSAVVHVKDRVVRGQRLALVGNSGASGAPHLHFSVQDWSDLSIRGRFHGEVRKGAAWVPFEGKDLEPGSTVRNAR